ncbi:MAG: amidase family protein [Polyangiales bacterium]
MLTFDEYRAHDGLGLAELVRTRQVSAAELLELAIARREQVDPRLNAVVIPMFEQARAYRHAPGPFAGVPFLIKDLYQDYAGVRATSGSAAYKRAGYVASQHAEIVARWLRAGVVVMGRTNTPEFGAKGTTEPAAWGPTRNPWDLMRTPGGSSGGSAAAVAAGIVPLAGASDGGGSIRIPAACTGLFGFKPGRGRTPIGPEAGEALHGAALNHVLTRSVRDSAAMLDATHGGERASLFALAPPERPYADEVTREPGRLRIAFSTRSPIGAPVHADAVAAIERTARLLERLGHDVEQAEPELDGVAMARDFCTVWFAQLARVVEETQRLLGSAELEFDTIAMAAVARSTSSVAYATSYGQWLVYTRQLNEFLAERDLFMTPTLAAPPPEVGARTTPLWAERAMRMSLPLGGSRLIPLASGTIQQTILANLGWVPFTQLANITGVPAMSVPLERFESGLPLGVLFVAAPGGEGRLFALAGQLERAAPWDARRASV